MRETMEQVKSFSKIKKKPHKNVHKFVNNYNLENPKKFKKQIREQRIQIQNSNVNRKRNSNDKKEFREQNNYHSYKK